MTTSITDLEGQVVEITRTNGKVNAGRLVVEGDTLKLKNPAGGRGRPAVITLTEVHSFVVVDATVVSTNGTKPVKAKANSVKVSKSEVKPTPVPLPVQIIEEDEEEDDVVESPPLEVDKSRTIKLHNPRSLKLKVTRPVRRCPKTGNPITKENGVAITFFENGEERKFYFERTGEVAEFITMIRPDVEPTTLSEEEEEDDE